MTNMKETENLEIIRIYEADHTLITTLFDQYRVFYGQNSDPDLAERYIKTRLETRESVIFAALATGPAKKAAVGFTQLYPTWSSVNVSKNWILNDLYTMPEFRKKGVGRALIDKAKSFTRDQGATWLQLETAKDNLNAQSLYENCGFLKTNTDESIFIYRTEVQ